jgi:hypothetical protein
MKASPAPVVSATASFGKLAAAATMTDARRGPAAAACVEACRAARVKVEVVR